MREIPRIQTATLSICSSVLFFPLESRSSTNTIQDIKNEPTKLLTCNYIYHKFSIFRQTIAHTLVFSYILKDLRSTEPESPNLLAEFREFYSLLLNFLVSYFSSISPYDAASVRCSFSSPTPPTSLSLYIIRKIKTLIDSMMGTQCIGTMHFFFIGIQTTSNTSDMSIHRNDSRRGFESKTNSRK